MIISVWIQHHHVSATGNEVCMHPLYLPSLMRPVVHKMLNIGTATAIFVGVADNFGASIDRWFPSPPELLIVFVAALFYFIISCISLVWTILNHRISMKLSTSTTTWCFTTFTSNKHAWGKREESQLLPNFLVTIKQKCLFKSACYIACSYTSLNPNLPQILRFTFL